MLSQKNDNQVSQICCIKRRLCNQISTAAPASKLIKLIGLVIVFWFIISTIYLNLVDLQYLQQPENEFLNFPVQIQRGPRILCYVLLSQKNLHAGKVIQQTWGSKCDRLIFYGHFEYSSADDVNITDINAKEGYPYLWNKTKTALLHLHQNYGSEFNWFLKVDDDTFVIVESLRRFVQNLDSSKPSWTGFKLRSSRTKHAYMSGGAGYLYSSGALEKVAGLLQNTNTASFNQLDDNKSTSDVCNANSDIGYEDLEIGRCFNEAGVQELTSADSKGRQRFLPLPLQQLLNNEVSSFHWLRYQSWDDLKLGRRCCSPSLITIHKMSPSEMNVLNFLLYNVTTEFKQSDKISQNKSHLL